jgi:hypothetical protein
MALPHKTSKITSDHNSNIAAMFPLFKKEKRRRKEEEKEEEKKRKKGHVITEKQPSPSPSLIELNSTL